MALPSHQSKTRRRDLIIVSSLLLASFGPYLVGSIRTEQIAVYTIALCATLAILSSVQVTRDGLPFLFSWFFLILVTCVSSLAPANDYFSWGQGNFLSGLDNFLLPFAIMLIIWGLIQAENARAALVRMAKITVWFSAGNALISIFQSRVDMSFILRNFWASASASVTTAERAELGLRYSGIFNQPAEVGALYSLATILAIWLYWKRPLFLYSALTLLALGGVFAITKSYLYIGLPIGIVYLLSKYKGPARIFTLLIIISLGLVVSQLNFLTTWGGLDRIGQLAAQVFAGGSESGDRVRNLTAGRWNEEARIVQVMNAVLESRPLNGYGFAGLDAAYDSLWTEVLVQAGLLGIICVVIPFILLLAIALRTHDKDLKHLIIAITICLLAASFGLPTLTSNRVATVAWLVISLLVLEHSYSKEQKFKDTDANAKLT